MVEYIVNGVKIKVNVFEKVRNYDDAYFLGYLFADGGYHRPTHKRNHRVAVSSTDIYLIDAFIEKYQPTSTIMVRQPNDNLKLNIYGKKQYKNFVLSSKFSPYLEKFGVMCLKKDRVYQNIPNKVFPSFLLGVFDGDGSISWGKRKDRDRLWADFKITHQSVKFLLKIQKHLSDNYQISSFVVPKGSGEDCFVLRVSDRHAVCRLFDILYSQKPFINNKAKQENFKNYYTQFKQSNAT